MAGGSEPKRKGRPPKKVQYNVFQTLSGYTLDDYWKQLLLACSMGKFPRYVTYKDDLLIHRRGRACSSIPLSSINDRTTDFKRVLDFFRTLGLSSLQDNEAARRLVDDKQKTLTAQVYHNWKDVKRPQLREVLVGDFIQSFSERLDLTSREHEYLQAQMAIAQLFKAINVQTVVMAEGKISDIVGLQVEGEERGKRRFSFLRPSALTSSTSSPGALMREELEAVDLSQDLRSNWTQYCDNLRRITDFTRSLPRL
jgi:hypothetical protein